MSRFIAGRPNEFHDRIDLAYCIYVFQHIPAIEIREVLQRIHYYLQDDGVFVYCSSDYRMAIRFDLPGFEDDSRLGSESQAGDQERGDEEIAPRPRTRKSKHIHAKGCSSYEQYSNSPRDTS